MNAKTFYGFILVTALLLFFIALKSLAPSTTTGPRGKTFLLDTFVGKSHSEITTLKVKNSKNTFHLDKKDTVWMVREKNAYPADIRKVSSALFLLSDSKLVEKKTSNPEFFGRLGLDAPPEGEGTLFSLSGVDDKSILNLIIGRQSSAGNNLTYVRELEGTQAWLVTGDLRLDPMVTDWLSKELIHVPQQDIHKITFILDEQSEITLVRKGKAQLFEVMGVENEKALEFESSDLAAGLEYLRLEDVILASDASVNKAQHKITYHCFDGRVITVSLFDQDKDTKRLMLSAAFDETLAKSFLSEGEVDIDKKNDEVEKLNRQWQGWQFVIAPYKIANFFVDLSQFEEKKS